MKTTLTYKILRKFSLLSDPVKYGNISIWKVIKHIFRTIRNLLLYKYCYSSFILEPLNFRKIRAKFWRIIGCNMGKSVFIGHSVTLDYGNAHLIYVGTNVSITDNCILLCHRKNISNYRVGDNSADLPFLLDKIIIADGVNIGKGSIIMPGVEIGEGSVIGAGSVVTKNIPAWCIAAGNPAKVIKKIEERL